MFCKLSKYYVKTEAGGDFIANVYLEQTQSDPEYSKTLDLPSYFFCGDMTRWSYKYPAVGSWSVDTRLSSREGNWQNNNTEDYEYLYEVITGNIEDTPANAEKFIRLRERKFITDDGQVNIMVANGEFDSFFGIIPDVEDDIKNKITELYLESASMTAKLYPPQMCDLIMETELGSYAGGRIVALMVMDILYSNGTFRPLTEDERVTSNLIMFSDILPK